LFAYSGIQTVAVGGALNLDHLLSAWGMALAENVNMGSLKWVMQPGDFVALRKVKDTSGKYILNADPSADAVFRLFGAPVIV
ncbi:phage major capsid protein, partial [Enterococcus faecium]